MRRYRIRYILLAITALGLLVWGAALTIPNSFTDGDVISASEMNANFTAVKSAVDTLETQQPGGAQVVNINSQPVSGAVASFAAVDVVAPGPGYVLVIASSEVQFAHTNGSTSNVNFGVSESATAYDDDQDKDLTVSSNAPSGTYVFAGAAQKMFPVSSAGTYTYHVIAFGTTNADIVDITLSAMYIPTAAGTVSQTSISPASAGSGD